MVRAFLGFWLCLSSSVLAQQGPVNLQIAMYPYVPEAESAIEQLEAAFEEYATVQGKPIDVDFVLLDTYGVSVEDVDKFDVVELDLCVLDALKKDGKLPLDDIPADVLPDAPGWLGPAAPAMTREWASKVLPHWVCGNYLVHWSTDQRLTQAMSFSDVIEALDPSNGKFLFADIWGGGTLGELYADAVLDIYGAEEAREHLSDLAETPAEDVRRKLRADAVLALYRLTSELKPEHRRKREAIHNLTFIYPRFFSNEPDSALIGYSERLHFVERQIQEEPWTERSFPLSEKQLCVRQFPFSSHSQGTPTWVDAFVIPEGRLDSKRDSINLFLKFAISDEGYRCLLEPRKYYPASYLLPAHSRTYESEFVTTQMPSIGLFRTAIDGSFPMLDHTLFQGVEKAGEALKQVLSDN